MPGGSVPDSNVPDGSAPVGRTGGLLGFRWARKLSLTARILAVNVIALGLMAGSLLYLDSYRRQLLAERFSLARSEAQITADALGEATPAERTRLLVKIGPRQHMRLRVYAADGSLVADSFTLAPPAYAFTDPARESLTRKAARVLDRITDLLLGAPPIEPYTDHKRGDAWPEVAQARRTGATIVRRRAAPDRTPVITAAAPIGGATAPRGEILLATRNATDITQAVRDARQTLAIVSGLALAVSIYLSLFLARTIARPLRVLARAAVRVRLGRDREVVVPRLPDRRDEIGLLARAVSDMAAALRRRIDEVESFAADVAHELKNPLASLRSALESLDRVDDPALRAQLSAIAAHDVRRIDRLVTEIADASRIDAELSRTEFEPVDMLRLCRALVAERDQRTANGASRVAILARSENAASENAASTDGDWIVAGDPPRLERVLHNLLDNAVSFSDGAPIEVEVSRSEAQVTIAVCDHGPGIPSQARDKVFERFHSLRPAAEDAIEDFGSHSGLGLAIARTIVEAHNGTLTAHDRPDGAAGAFLVADLPAWDPLA